MDIPTALHVIDQVAAQHHGNLADHQNIQEALGTIRQALTPPAEEVAGDPGSGTDS